MGVLTDYFRAADRAAVELLMRADTISPVGREPGCDGIMLKHIDDTVVLGKLVAAITGAPWAVNLTGSVTVFPPADTRPVDHDGWVNLPEDSPWATGPWVTEISDQTRDVLASLDPDRIPWPPRGLLPKRSPGSWTRTPPSTSSTTCRLLRSEPCKPTSACTPGTLCSPAPSGQRSEMPHRIMHARS